VAAARASDITRAEILSMPSPLYGRNVLRRPDLADSARKSKNALDSVHTGFLDGQQGPPVSKKVRLGMPRQQSSAFCLVEGRKNGTVVGSRLTPTNRSKLWPFRAHKRLGQHSRRRRALNRVTSF
jgi:hypothetical protein